MVQCILDRSVNEECFIVDCETLPKGLKKFARYHRAVLASSGLDLRHCTFDDL